VGTDTHIVMVPSAAGPVPTPTPMAFRGQLDGGLSGDVLIEGQAAAVKGSTASNTPAHVAPSGTFQKPPSNKGTIDAGSATVLVNGSSLARAGDAALTCNDPGDAPNGTVMASCSVWVG
jgi:uncharacterized Zn-binding protein involved in type VI secretion